MSRKKRGFANRIISWARDNLREFPWRRDRTPFRVLVAEFLLKRTTATAAEKVYKDFISRYPDIESLSRADRNELETTLSRIGLQKQRGKGMLEAARFIVDNYQGEIPADRSRLLEVPHVGDYTADAVLSLGFGVPTGLLDSNVERVLKRLHSKIEGLDKKTLAQLAESYAPEKDNDLYNLGLLDLGALVCRYDKPLCGSCPVRGLCDYHA